jgi:hypothetical protein
MKKILNLFAIVLMTSLMWSCGDDGPKPVDVEGYDSYTDDVVKFELQYPKNWHVKKRPGLSFATYSSKAGASRADNYGNDGFPAAKIQIYAVSLDSAKTYDIAVKDQTAFLEDIQGVGAPTSLTIDGQKAMKYAYEFELTDGMFNGEMYVASADPKMLTVVKFETFGGTMEKYKTNFAEILKSVKLAIAPVVLKEGDTLFTTEEIPPPSTSLVTKSGDGFTIKVPDNFKIYPAPKAGEMKQYNYAGERRGDCTIRIDIFDASKTKSLEKIVKDNMRKVNEANDLTRIKLGNNEAFRFQYSPGAKYDAKVYYTSKDKILYRITLIWFKKEADNYKDIFIKSARSFRLK